MEGKPHDCFSKCWLEYLRACGVTHNLNAPTWQLAGGAKPGGFRGWFWTVSLEPPAPGDKQRFDIPCLSGGFCASDKSCISDLSPQTVVFLSNRTFQQDCRRSCEKLRHQCHNSELQRGVKKFLAVLAPSWSSFVFNIRGLCPAHKVLAASFSSSQVLACLLLKGWVRFARFANFLAKMHPLKGRDPAPIGAVTM